MGGSGGPAAMLATFYGLRSMLDQLVQLTLIKLICDRRGGQCDDDAVTRAASAWNVYLNYAASGLALVSACSYGGLSDGAARGLCRAEKRAVTAFGRRPLMLLHVSGLLVYTLIGWAVLWLQLPVLWLLAGAVIWGLAGGKVAAAGCGFAMCSDLVPRESRSRHFNWLEASLFVGAGLGNGLAGPLWQIHPLLPFGAAAGVGLLLLLGVLLSAESLREDSRREFDLVQSSTPVALWQLVQGHRVRPLLAGCLVCLCCALGGWHSTVILEVKRRDWTDALVSTFLATREAVRAAAIVCMAPWLFARNDWASDRRAAGLGCGMLVAAYTCYGLAATTWAMFLCLLLEGLGACGMPSLRAMFSKTSSLEQGKMMAGVAGFETIGALVGPTLFNTIFDKTLEVPVVNVAFVSMAADVALGLVFVLAVDTKLHLEPDLLHIEPNERQADAAEQLVKPDSSDVAHGLMS